MSKIIIIPQKDQNKYKSDSGSYKRKWGYQDDDNFVVSDSDDMTNSNDSDESSESYEESESCEDIFDNLTDSDEDSDTAILSSPPKKCRYNLRSRISNVKIKIRKAKDNGLKTKENQARKILYYLIWNKALNSHEADEAEEVSDEDESDTEYFYDKNLHEKILNRDNTFDKYLKGLLDTSESEEEMYELDKDGMDEDLIDKKTKRKEKRVFEKEFEKYLTDEIFDEVSQKKREFTYFKDLSLDEKKKFQQMESEVKNSMYLKVPLKFKILNTNLPTRVKGEILNKLRQFDTMDPSNGEYGKLENWIMATDKLPFDEYINLPVKKGDDPEKICNFLSNAAKCLDKSINGQYEAKNKIMQVVAKWIRNDKAQGNVIGLKGPPGVGKTTLINHGLSKALNIPMKMISLGGCNDQSILTGHMYTWEGSTWGRIAGILMETQCMNPIIFFDELDKVGGNDMASGGGGSSITNTLMHLIDFSQNHKFHDNFLQGIDLDMSKCVFIFSYNDESKIDPILLDRITTITMDGYKKKDKVTIARNYLIPEILNSIGLNVEDIILSDETILYIINSFTEEKGVRKLKEKLETIYMKINLYAMSVGGLKEMNLTYNIPDFKLPLLVNNELAKELLKEKNDPLEIHQKMMYI